jgi:hypothetical protein
MTSMASSRYTGTPPDIAHMRSHGVTRVSVHCSCGHRGKIALDAIGLPDDLPFSEIGKRKRLVCSKCGSRSFKIMPDWPVGNGGQGGGHRGN